MRHQNQTLYTEANRQIHLQTATEAHRNFFFKQAPVTCHSMFRSPVSRIYLWLFANISGCRISKWFVWSKLLTIEDCWKWYFIQSKCHNSAGEHGAWTSTISNVPCIDLTPQIYNSKWNNYLWISLINSLSLISYQY